MGHDCKDGDCGCGHHHEMDEDECVKELTYSNNERLNVLLNLLVKKGVITETDFYNEYESMVDELETDEKEDE